MSRKLLILFALTLSLTACSHDYPLVANGYDKTADLSALDNHGLGNFALPVPPKGCLLAFRAMPNLAEMQIRVVVKDGQDLSYSSKDLANALAGQDFSTGVFVVDPAGMHFQKDYECDTEVKQ